METDGTDETILNGLVGHVLTGWQIGDGGMHFYLDDGRAIIFSGAFVIAVMRQEEHVIH